MSSLEAVMEAVHTIGVVARRTGLSVHALRAWERRYGVVEPVRSAGGERLYSEGDIVRLRLLKRLTDAGHGIGKIAGLGLEELRQLTAEAEAPVPEVGRVFEADVAGEGLLMVAEEALLKMDGDALRAILMREVVRSRAVDFIEGVAVPLLRRAGDLWSAGRICPVHEHVLSAELTRVLGWLAASLPAADAPRVAVAATPGGQRHEFGAQFAAIIAAEEGWRVAYLGPDLPGEDIGRACRMKGASLALLSVVTDDAFPEVLEEIVKVREAMGESGRILVGGGGVMGRGTELSEVGAVLVEDLAALRRMLGGTESPPSAEEARPG